LGEKGGFWCQKIDFSAAKKCRSFIENPISCVIAEYLPLKGLVKFDQLGTFWYEGRHLDAIETQL